MAELGSDNGLGYCKPPKHSRFTKGSSGNPKGRPKGSQNLNTILLKAARERVKVTVNGVVRYMSKLETGAMQLFTKAASGDPRAIREALYWAKIATEAQQDGYSTAELETADVAVMESMLKRIHKCESTSIDVETNSSEPGDKSS